MSSVTARSSHIRTHTATVGIICAVTDNNIDEFCIQRKLNNYYCTIQSSLRQQYHPTLRIISEARKQRLLQILISTDQYIMTLRLFCFWFTYAFRSNEFASYIIICCANMDWRLLTKLERTKHKSRVFDVHFIPGKHAQ